MKIAALIRWSAVAIASIILPLGIGASIPAKAEPADPGGLRAAPYFMPLDNDPQNISRAIERSGQRDYILAFVLAPDNGECTPTWDGKEDQQVADDTAVAKTVDAIRAEGGDVSVSFGGYNGVELGAACPDAASLAGAYQQVIDKYDLTHIDLDVEGDDLGDVAGETRRFRAVEMLKQRNSDLHVTLTLPMTTVGLSGDGEAEIQRAKEIGAEIDLFKIMDFDYGGPGDDMADSAISVAEAFHKQLRELHPEFDDAAAYERTGVILMNGHTDQPSELFTQDTFRALLNYAQKHQIGRFSFWSLNRDRPCTEPGGGWADGTCSSIEQQPYAFSKIVSEYQ